MTAEHLIAPDCLYHAGAPRGRFFYMDCGSRDVTDWSVFSIAIIVNNTGLQIRCIPVRLLKQLMHGFMRYPGDVH